MIKVTSTLEKKLRLRVVLKEWVTATVDNKTLASATGWKVKKEHAAGLPGILGKQVEGPVLALKSTAGGSEFTYATTLGQSSAAGSQVRPNRCMTAIIDLAFPERDSGIRNSGA